MQFGGSGSGLDVMNRVASLLAAVGVDSARAGGPEADVSPLFAMGVPVADIDVDGSRYFWYHHSEADTMDKLDPRDMARCVAVLAVVANTVANMDAATVASLRSATQTTH
jgi:carboxypeptidase Q